MPRFHFNMRTADHLVEDIEGTDLADLAAAEIEAIEDARAAMSVAILKGIDLSAGSSIEIRDEAGVLLRRIAFSEAIIRRS